MQERKSELSEIMQLLYGLSYALYGIKEDIEDLKKYKQNNLENISIERIQEMKILALLEKLGYPMNEVGTYLYKHMIIKIVKYLDKGITKEDKNGYKELIIELKNCYSNFYLELARFELDMGIKTFHQYIIETISKIDYSKIDLDIYNKVFGNINREVDYGEQAFILGSYITKNLEQKTINDENKKDILKVKRLVNAPYVN